MLRRFLGKIKARLFPPQLPDVFLRYDPNSTPGPGEIQDYYDRFLEHTRNYDAGALPPRFEEAFAALAPLVQPGAAVLDLGCGTGITTEWLAGRGARVLGVDLSPKTIAYAQETRKGCSFMSADATALRLDRTFELIVMVDMLEHIPPQRREALWDTVARHSAPGARVFISVPDAGHIRAARRTGGRHFQIVDEPVPVDEVAAALAARGFSLDSQQVLSVQGREDTCQLLFRRTS